MLTPQTKSNNLAKALGLNTDLYLKREDLHPYGSHKGRSIPVMINKYVEQGVRDFVISSSGNAALAAAMYINEHNQNNPTAMLTLQIFVGEKVDPEKFNLLTNTGNDKITITKVNNPKQQAFQIDKSGQAKLLRQSTDNTALIGYKELAEELNEIKNLAAVFIPTSSGTTAVGLEKAFTELGINPQIHIVQTTACHPMVSGEDFENNSIANAIVDKVAFRKKEVGEIIEKSSGNGWIANNEEILDTIKLVTETENISLSPNSALAVVGLIQAIKSGLKFNGPVVCLITGK